MIPTLEDYWRAVSSFVTEMDRLGDAIKAIILSGSLARGQAIPGKSDLLDALIIFRRGVLEERAEHRRIVEAMVDAHTALAGCGLPFVHPCHYFAEDELADLEGLYFSGAASPDASRILAGEDVRSRMSPGPGAEAAAHCVFFAMRQRYMNPLSVSLLATELPESQQIVLFRRLCNMEKRLPLSVCVALRLGAGEAAAPRRLRQALPDLDYGVLDEIAAIRHDDLPLGGDAGVRSLLRRALILGEQINERILALGIEPWRELLA